MRKPELAAAIAEKADLTKEKANEVLTLITDEITNALAREESVTLIGFGTFSQRTRSARKGKNPKTGAEIDIPASKSVGFKPGKVLKDSVAGN
ncbi:MAG: HU family DNA-binding protein [Hahellaceae bacterium]|nr:HU family DNA-binding protein [Hahellaceae bacterium]MCP5169312.1 HU family DNA-binding protein [Hahellaceae bacterium]